LALQVNAASKRPLPRRFFLQAPRQNAGHQSRKAAGASFEERANGINSPIRAL
jgi:hypothetical protein